jgi:aspartyl-tRNA(Asn)/glutamyl-tRNA(Gln) amidotransferase subunit B
MIIYGTNSILPVIGLEIHIQLKTESKLFCRCKNSFGAPPNTHVCPVCLGLPGAMPVLNRKAIKLSMKVGLALNCTIASITKWDRKSYYYPDLPKNYQISQYDMPLSCNGFMEVPSGEGVKKIRITRAHLEEDAGKNIHDNPSHTNVDLNRAGIPLLEIVSEPDMNTKDEVLYYARTMQGIVRWLDASEANMEMGHMRFEPNINLHITRGKKIYKTPIVEVKNLNSFKALEKTVEYEIQRQYEEWLDNPEEYSLEKLGKQNRGYDVASGETVFQREKEEAHDYRYFPEPDLVPVCINKEWVSRIRKEIGETPLTRSKRYKKQYNLSEREISLLTQDKDTGDLLDEAVKQGGMIKRCVNLILGVAKEAANQKNCPVSEIGIKPDRLAELSCMLDEGKITSTAGTKIFYLMLDTGDSPMSIAKKNNLLVLADMEELNRLAEEVIAANPEAREEAISNSKKAKKAFGFLMGQIMQKSKGKAPPLEAKRILKKILGL